MMILLLLSNSGMLSSRPGQTSSAHPAGVITGRVVDDDGRPMRGLEVKALAYGDENGKRRLVPRGLPAKTNDRGEFRLFWLDPGTYYLVASLPQVMLDRYRGPQFERIIPYIPSDSDASFVTTYFPGTAEIGGAQPIEVGGSEIDVHAFPMAALATRVVRAKLINPALDETTGPNPIVVPNLMTVTLRTLADSPYTPSYLWTMLAPGGNGTFEISTGLAPGSYALNVEVLKSDGVYAGTGKLTVEGADSDIVQIRLSKSITASKSSQ